MLVSMKSDLIDTARVSGTDADTQASTWGVMRHSCSAKTGNGIDRLIGLVVSSIEEES